MIDFRSDTVTRPCIAMRQAMAKAHVGDDVFGDDPSINASEKQVAELTGMEAALLVPSGTQSNLLALLTHCGRGDEYIVGQEYHSYLYEAGGAATLGSIVPQPVAVEKDGTLDLRTVKRSIKPSDSHYANSKLLCFENTHSGKIIPNSYLEAAVLLARQHQLSIHLDGARVFNAAVAQNISVQSIVQRFDSVSVCFSKALGAPVGSMLCGTESFIQQARRWRKMVGGGMRQAGVLAAAIQYALANNVQRLQTDHEHAQFLENELQSIDEVYVEPANTNILYLEFSSEEVGATVARHLKQQDILVLPGKRMRLVTHLDILKEDIQRFVAELKTALLTSK